MPVALITGGSRGFGLALTRALCGQGWDVVVDARNAPALLGVTGELGASVRAIPGDVADPAHRLALASAVSGSLDLLVNNASLLGPSPLPPLRDHPIDELERIFAANAVAPLALAQLLLPALRAAHGAIVNVTSDAAVEAYPGWGGYGASKAALDRLSAVLAVEEPDVGVYAFDPGDMRTAMHQAAYPDEDISDRPEPEAIVPALVRLVDDRPPSGRYRAADLLVGSRA